MTQRLRYPELAPAGIAALTGVEHYLNAESPLEPVLLGLIRFSASLLNGCEYCIGLHAAELAKYNEPASRVAAVRNWRGSDAFTERERAALTWTEVITNIQQSHAPDEAFAAVRVHFTDVEVVNLTLAIASINAWNRMAIAFRPPWRGRPAPVEIDASPVADEDDHGKVAGDR